MQNMELCLQKECIIVAYQINEAVIDVDVICSPALFRQWAKMGVWGNFPALASDAHSQLGAFKVM